MVDSIKITALQDIGANIAYTTLVPVVNMSGTPVTQKSNLQNLGNLILNGAGGSYFPRAAQANIALSVANAAQPNITSVGTLTSLAVTGNITAGNVNGGNIVVANFFYGDGGFLTNVSSGSNYSNSNVANYLPTYTGNISGDYLTLTHDVTANVVDANFLYGDASNVTNLPVGNIAVINLDGNVANVLHGDGSWSADQTTYSNSNVANYLPTYTGNIGANVITNSANLTIQTDTGNANVRWVFGAGGALYWPSVPGGEWAIEPNGDGEFEIHSHTNVVISTDSTNSNYHFTFDSSGSLSFPTNNLYINGDTSLFGSNSAIIQTGSNVPLALITDGPNSSLDSIWLSNIADYANANIAAIYVNPSAATGAVRVVTGNNATNVYTWTFNPDGLMTLPEGAVIDTTGNNFEVRAVENVNLEANSVVNIYTDGSGNAYQWQFGDDGLITLPGGYVKIGAQYGSDAILSSNVSFGVATQGNATTYMNWSDDVANTSMLAAIYVNDPTGNAGNISVRTGNVGNANVWKFVTDGSVIFPTLTVDIHNGGNQQAQTLQFGDPSQQAIITGPTPAANVNAERLIIQGQRGNGTGEGGDVYFWAGDADTNGGDIKIYAGDADNVSTGYGGYINLDGGSGFDAGGQVNITGGYSANGQGGTVSVSAGQGGTDGGAININGGSATANQGGNIALQAGYGGNNGGEVRLTGGSAGTGIPGYGNVVLVSGASTWTFDNNGNLVLAGGNSVIQSIANSSLDPTNPNVSTMTLTPDPNYNSQILVLDPTAPGHIHLRAYCFSNIDDPAANIFLGGENTAFEITQGANNVAKIHSGGNTWTFDTVGNLTTPGNINFSNGSRALLAYGANNYINMNNDGGMDLSCNTEVKITTNYGDAPNRAYSYFYANGTFSAAGNITTSANVSGDVGFFNDVNLNNVTTNKILYADGNRNIYDTGFGYDSANDSMSGGNISLTGNITGNTNGFAIGYLNIPQVSASNTTLGLTDAGKHYYSTTAGNLTLTIPLNSTTAFPTGTAISIVVQAAGNVLVNAASGVTLYMAGSSSAGNRVVGTYGMATLMKVASDTWFINGTGVY